MRRRELRFSTKELALGALKNQRDDLLAFAKVLDAKLADIAQRFETSLYLVRAVYLLHRKKPSSSTYWQRWNQLHSLA